MCVNWSQKIRSPVTKFPRKPLASQQHWTNHRASLAPDDDCFNHIGHQPIAKSRDLRGVVHSQIGCTDFKSSEKFLDFFFYFFGFFRIFWIFSDFLDFLDFLDIFDFSKNFLAYEDFINKKGFKHWIRVVHSQIRYTDFKSSKKSLNSLDFFGFFDWTTPRWFD